MLLGVVVICSYVLFTDVELQVWARVNKVAMNNVIWKTRVFLFLGCPIVKLLVIRNA